MEYHAPTNQFTFTPESLKAASGYFRYAIKKIREGGNLDPKGYDSLKRVGDATEYAEGAILSGCDHLGINLGADRPGILDVSNE